MATGWPMKTTYANGDVYSASDVNDITGTINLLGSSVAYTAGKNAVINGAMDWSQRGTTFTNPASQTYTLDRYKVAWDGTGATQTVSQQTFTPGTCPTGYESKSFMRWAVTVNGTGNTYRAILNNIENVQTFAGQKVTISFFAKADASRTLGATYLSQNFGSGGSSQVDTAITLNSTSLTTSWQRFYGTVTLPSISGKTVGTSSYLQFSQYLTANTTMTTDIWGLQVELGAAPTAFQTATGTIQGELAACQRYYQKSYNQATTPGTDITSSYSGAVIFGGWGSTSAAKVMQYPHKITMRTTPTISFWDLGGNASKITTFDTGFSRTNNVAASGGTIISEDNHSVNPGTSTINGWSWCYAASAEL